MNEIPDRRRAILDAALACFLEHGYRATSIAQIRQKSGASTGSIYHFFSGKGAIAEALFRQAIAGWSAFAPSPTASAEAQIKASVAGLVIWGLAHPDQSRLLDELRNLAPLDDELQDLRAFLASGHDTAAAAFSDMQAKGEVQKLPFLIAHALMLGPAYSYLRTATPTPADAAKRIAAVFAEAAWQSVKA